MLALEWSADQAADLFWTILSVRTWELLTLDCGWPTQQYIGGVTALLKQTFVREAAEEP